MVSWYQFTNIMIVTTTFLPIQDVIFGEHIYPTLGIPVSVKCSILQETPCTESFYYTHACLSAGTWYGLFRVKCAYHLANSVACHIYYMLHNLAECGVDLSVLTFHTIDKLARLSHWWLGGVAMILTHWGWDKMDAIFQTTFSNTFSWMKIYEYRLKVHWRLFLGVELTISQHWFR